MSETSTELFDSLIPLANIKAERIGRSLRRVSAAVQIGLSDAELNPELLNDERRAELEELANGLLAFMHEGFSLFKDVVEVGGLAIEENGGGLPIRAIAPSEQVPKLEAPSSSHETSDEEVEVGDVPDGRPETALPCIDIIVDDDRMLTNKFLKLTHIREVELLRLLPKLDGQPLTRKWVMEQGFYPDGKTPVARNQAYADAIASVTTNLEAACLKPILEKVGIKGGTRYLVRSPMIINGEDVAVSVDQVKKKT